MGIFSALFGKSKPISATSSPALVKKTGEILEHAMQMISVGSFKHLVDRYQPIYGEDAQYLAAQVLMLAILQENRLTTWARSIKPRIRTSSCRRRRNCISILKWR